MIKQITNVTSEELVAILDIWLQANIDAHHFIPKEYWERNYEFVRSTLPKTTLFTYCVGNEIVGFLGLMGSYIAGIFVKKQWRSCGIGRKLINTVKAEKMRLSLSVYDKNERAISFYLSEGFTLKEKKIESETNEIESILFWASNR
ncbi:CEL_1a_G0018040.mRNA.1.CDS.1 [Saccharomyces cerevisiae]|nr:CEL_1a_G0018040.mRNA.1.CDS.1 [Saccharomyces cerevisiae]CAI7282818.1 CEL_1a_G0018040.mRNA.1.CDS.1 [Saccharomyces cerevisiae]